MPVFFHHFPDCFLLFQQFQTFLVPHKQFRQFPGAGYFIPPVSFQSTVIDRNVFHPLIQLPYVIQGIQYPVVAAKPYHGEGNRPLVTVRNTLQFLTDTVNGMIIIGNEKHGSLIEKSRNNGIDNRVCLARAGRPLNICQGIFHGIVDGQKLIHINLSV